MIKIKKLFFMLIVASTFVACSQSDLTNVVEEESTLLNSKTLTDNEILTNSKTLTDLSSFNEEILKSKNNRITPRSSRWHRWRRGLFVAAVDAVGAWEGFRLAQGVAGVVGAATGGTGYAVICVAGSAIVGASHSITAYNALPNSIYVEQETDEKVFFPTLPAEAYVDLYGSNVGQGGITEAPAPTTNSYEYNYILARLNIPVEFQYLKRVGEDHNKIVELSYRTGLNGDPVMATRGYPEEEEEEGPIELPEIPAEAVEMISELVYSPEFQEAQEAMELNVKKACVSGTFDVEVFLEESPMEDKKVEEAIKLYLSLYVDFPDNLDDIVLIANGYIDVIERNNEFSYSDKEAIYAAIIVSLYSPQIWN